MSFVERLKTGELCVPMYYNGKNTRGLVVGDAYTFNYEIYKVVEVCKDDLEGYCWIARSMDND